MSAGLTDEQEQKKREAQRHIVNAVDHLLRAKELLAEAGCHDYALVVELALEELDK